MRWGLAPCIERPAQGRLDEGREVLAAEGVKMGVRSKPACRPTGVRAKPKSEEVLRGNRRCVIRCGHPNDLYRRGSAVEMCRVTYVHLVMGRKATIIV